MQKLNNQDIEKAFLDYLGISKNDLDEKNFNPNFKENAILRKALKFLITNKIKQVFNRKNDDFEINQKLNSKPI